MDSHTDEKARFLQPGELDLLTDMLVEWCRNHGRDYKQMLSHSAVILRRWHDGQRDPKMLFEGLE